MTETMTPAKIQRKSFRAASGRRELHAIITPADPAAPFEAQLSSVAAGVLEQASEELRPVLVRYFLTDPANQAAAVDALGHPCAVSVIGQPPLGGYKVAAWAWYQEGVTPEDDAEGFCRFRHDSGNYTTLLQTQACEPGLHSSTATRAMLSDLALRLTHEGGLLLDNCLRTWLFVRDVDVNYAGAVAGRNELFAINGLTTDTHFLASTGINGVNADPTVTVTMDSLNYLGVKPEQVTQLHAREFLNPTAEYGVAFERGTLLDFGDRRHVYISGTASIDNRGEVVHPGNVAAQTERMLLNIEALLAEAGCDFGDVGHMLVYLRDLADRDAVERIFAERFPEVPHILLLAPVCRPAWLVETECMAFKAVETPYAPF